MAAPRKYSDELRERATRMAVEARKDPAARTGAVKRIADQIDVHPEALRTWVKRAETDERVVPLAVAVPQHPSLSAGTASTRLSLVAAVRAPELGVGGDHRAARRAGPRAGARTA